MKKRILSLLLSVAIFVSMIPWQTTARAATTGGSCGDNATWSFDETTGTLTISGTGDMPDYTYFPQLPWEDIAKDILGVVIGEGITSVGDYAFYNINNVTSVTIPDSVTEIGSFAFHGCSSLSGITIPESVTVIGDYAFSGCSGLTGITIPGGVTCISDGVFSDCTNLTCIAIPEGVTSVGRFAFSNCYNLTDITIPEGVTSIGEYAFNDCRSLTAVTIPDSVTDIGDLAFAFCSSLTSISIPDNVTVIGEQAFKYCYALTSIAIPEGVTDIGDNTFAACTSLTTVMLPDSITSIGMSAFSGCTSLTDITIPEGVRSIGANAFEGCSSLTSIIIPYSMTNIGGAAFSSCDGLTDVYYGGTEEDWAAITIGAYNQDLLNATIHYDNTAAVYKELRYYYSLNEQEQRVYFGPNDRSGCLITEETDSAFRENPALLQGKYVVVEYRIVDGQEILLTMTECTEDLTAKAYQFSFTGNLASDRDVESTCYYTDGYFLIDSEVYNNHLSTMSMCFALTTWSRSPESKANWSLEISGGGNHRAQNAYDLLVGQLGFEDFALSDDWKGSPGKDTIGAVAASKMLTDGSRLIALGVRGGGYTQEWAGNFTVGKEGDHAGFAEAKEKVLAFLKDYISSTGITGDIKLWIVGYSRGGCVAGMVAGELNKDSTLLSEVSLAHDDLFCYTFEAPQGSLRSATAVGDHTNIHNIVNLNDIVPMVAPSDWGFDRYSSDRYLPSAATSDDWLADYMEMIEFYYTFIETDKDGNVFVPEYSVKENCKQFVLELHWDNFGFDGEPMIKKRDYFVPMQMVLNDSTDFIFGALAEDREDYYLNLQAGIRQLLAIVEAESPEDAIDSEARTISAQELLKILEDELIEKERIYDIVKPMYAFNLDSYDTRVDKVKANLDAFIQEVLTDSDLFGTVIFVANLKDTLSDILWRILEMTLEDLYHKDVQSLKNVISFFSVLRNVGRAHYSEVALSWLMSQDSYYNPEISDTYDCSMPSSRVIRINCPVDVKVYRVRTGELVAAITDDVAQDISSSIYAYLTPDGEKTIVLPPDAEYSIEITATADGTFNYTISEYNWVSLSNSRILSYHDIPIETGDTFTGTIPVFSESELSEGIPNGSSAEYVLTGDDGNEIALDAELTGQEAAEAIYTVTVTSNVANGSISGGGTYTYGSFAQVKAIPMPDEEFKGWYEGDVLVSQDAEYRFVVTRDTNLVAHFTGLAGYALDLDPTIAGDATSAWVDGVEYPIIRDGDRCYVDVPDTTATNLVVYTYNDPNAEDVHTQYPIGMKVWMLTFADGAYTATYVPEFDDLLQYSGSSIRIVGVKGIRMITSITKANKQALTGKGLAGYTLVEYGTALAWASDVESGNGLLLGEEYTKSNYAYKKDVADPVFKTTNTLMQYTNVLVGFSDDQCIPDIAMRPYIILEDAEGNQVTIYGGVIYRSVGYIAYQNRNAFKPGSNAYDYVWGIIHHVYGDQFDADYKG